jgi:DNA-binding transcriptional LysR family regulator
MELRQLEYFYTVSKLNNFTRAAEQLHVAQPSITNAIHNLEQELGVQLFDRTKRRITRTNEGEFFLERVEKILNNVQEAISDLNDLKNLNKGIIKLGIPPMIGAYLFPTLFICFKQAYPKLELQVLEEGSKSMLSILENDDLDLGIIILPEESKTLNMIPINTEQIVICLAEGHRLSKEKTISFRQLEDEQFILFKDDSYIRNEVIHQCNKYGFAPNIVLSSNQTETIKGLVSKGIGISFLMNDIAKNDDKFISIPLEEPMNVTIGLAWQKDKAISRAAQAFISFIVNYTKTKEFQDTILNNA